MLAIIAAREFSVVNLSARDSPLEASRSSSRRLNRTELQLSLCLLMILHGNDRFVRQRQDADGVVIQDISLCCQRDSLLIAIKKKLSKLSFELSDACREV